MSNYLPDESASLLQSVIKLLQLPKAIIPVEDLVLMVYNLGKGEGRLEQLERNEEIRREVHGERAS
jgi:hypothetical protein